MTTQIYHFFFIISLWNISTDSTLLFRAQKIGIALQLAINVSALVTIVPFYSFFKNVSEFSMLLLPILYSLPIEKKLKLISNPKNAKTLTNFDGIGDWRLLQIPIWKLKKSSKLLLAHTQNFQIYFSILLSPFVDRYVIQIFPAAFGFSKLLTVCTLWYFKSKTFFRCEGGRLFFFSQSLQKLCKYLV